MSTAWRTTSAPNRPPRSSGSEGGAPAAAGACANCGAALGTPYCGACGQRDQPHNPGAGVLVGELWDTFGTIDGKVVRTFALLAARPGALTVEWLHGRRAPYLRPLNVYLTASAAYFALVAATFHPEDLQARRSAEEVRRSAEFRAHVEQKYRTAPAPKRALLIGLARFGADPGEGMRVVVPQFSRILFALVPLFALLLQQTLRRRGWRYPAHLYFVLHVFAFYFVMLLVARVVHAYGPTWLHSPANWATNLGALAYFALAMRRVYGGRWWATAVRVAGVVVPFSAAFFVAMILFAVLTLGTR